MANYYSTDYNKILEEETAALEDLKKKQQDTINKTHDNKISSEKDIYGKAIDDAKVAYESEYQKNAVQKLINEKQIAERNANLGLTDSGLNRTQQTAVQLGYANQKGNIDLAKQNALDTLSQNLATSLANIEQSRITSLADLDTSIQSQAQSNAMNRYNTNVEANTKMFSASQNSSNSKGASFSEFNKINEDIKNTFKKEFWNNAPGITSKNIMNPYKKAAEKIYTYYASGFINDAQKQALINEYGIKDYFNSNNGIPIYTYEETPAARSFVAKIRTPHEFARGENSDKSTYKTYKDYVKGMLEKYESELTDDDIATISQMYGLE